MIDPAGISLASSIITLVKTGYDISKRTIEFSKLLGELPPDLQECSNLMGILVRASKRIQAQLEAEGPGIGPITAMHADLESLFNQCNQTASALLSCLDRLKSSNALSKAIQITRKESEILKTRNKLDQYILALLFIFEEHQQDFNEDLRNTAKGLRTDFYQFHQELVQQISHGFSHIENAINDSRESLLRDVRPLVAATRGAAQASNLRVLAGQQDLSQNLHRMEHNFASVLQDGEAGLAARFQKQLTEHQAATRTLFQSVYDRNDDLRAQIQLLYQEVTKALAEFDAAQKRSDVGIPNNHLRMKASFEFGIRNKFIALHINQGMEWVSSTVFFPAVRPSTWLDISLPIPRFGYRHERCEPLDTAVRSAPVNFLIQLGTDQYHLISVDMSGQQYDQGIFKALEKVYSDYKGYWWRWVSPYRILRISYVKYSSYSKTKQCFTAVERLNPESDDWRPIINPSPIRLHSLEHTYSLKNYKSYTSQGYEGFALSIEEGRLDTHLVPEFIACVLWFMVTVIQSLRNRYLGPDGVSLVVNAVQWDLALWASYCFVICRFRVKSTLLMTVAKVLFLWYHFQDEDTKLDWNGLTFVLVILISGVRYPTIVWLLAKQSIRIDWKEVRSFFR